MSLKVKSWHLHVDLGSQYETLESEVGHGLWTKVDGSYMVTLPASPRI
jgi:hypothetical protein